MIVDAQLREAVVARRAVGRGALEWPRWRRSASSTAASHPLIGPPRRTRRLALRDQFLEAARVVAGTHAAHGGRADLRPAQLCEFVGLGLLPLGH
ncbi:hypothetical protein ACFW2V_41110 [Streptomyces sp. NPDC058947]|uniref:Uncharacterized protein n=1 Tax=Streptomyces sp. R02 TaxID=3238623 RepID=A0AB39LE03_9ACTN